MNLAFEFFPMSHPLALGARITLFLGSHDEQSICPWGGEHASGRQLDMWPFCKDRDFGVRPGPKSCHCCQLLDLEQVTHSVGASAALRRAQSGEGPCSEPCLWRPSARQAGHSVLLCFHSSSYITALSIFQNKVILFTFIWSFQV